MLQSHVFWPKECRGHVLEARTILFHDMMHKEIEVYVEDMIVNPRMKKIIS